MAEANIDDAKAMGAPKEETDFYYVYISYVKSWIPINQKMVTETDKMLTNLQNAKITGLKIMANYPTTASEFEVAKNIKNIRSLEKAVLYLRYNEIKRVGEC